MRALYVTVNNIGAVTLFSRYSTVLVPPDSTLLRCYNTSTVRYRIRTVPLVQL